MASLDVLKEKLQKEIEKRDKAETNIKRLEIRIEQEELSTIKATMKAHNVSFLNCSLG